MAVQSQNPVRYLATARADDEEMARRIEEHRSNRPEEWVVVEEHIELAEAVTAAHENEAVLIDCVTLWISNLMVERLDAEILAAVDGVIETITARQSPVIVVSNEVGSGLVPMDPVGRRFRDLQGRANQRFAAVADEAFLVVSGRLLRLT